MADLVYNVAKVNVDTSALRAMLMVGHTPNQDHATLAAVIAGSGAEATFTNYVRKTLTGVGHTVDQSGNLGKITADNLVWIKAGGAKDELISHLVIYQHVAGGDANCIPVSCHGVGLLTIGGDVTGEFSTSGILITS